MPALPAAESHAATAPVLVLRGDTDRDEITRLVRAYLDALVRADTEGFRRLLARDAALLGAAGGGRETVLQQWALRQKSVDYARWAGMELFVPDEMGHFAFDELGAPPLRARPPEMQRGDLLLRVPIHAAGTGQEGLPDVLALLLRREAGAWKIAALGDELR